MIHKFLHAYLLRSRCYHFLSLRNLVIDGNISQGFFARQPRLIFSARSPSCSSLSMTNSNSPISRRVRDTFDRTWLDFHKFKPPSVRPVDVNHLIVSAVTCSEIIIARTKEIQTRCAQLAAAYPGHNASTVSSSPTSHSRIHSSSLPPRNVIIKMGNDCHSNLSQYGELSQPRNGSEILHHDVSPLPHYTFCNHIRESWVKAEEKSIPFLPSFYDVSNFREKEYEELFGERYACSNPGRDADGKLNFRV